MKRTTRGLVRKMRKSVDLGQNLYPKPGLNGHKVSWYLDGHLVSRPVNGVFAMVRFADHLLSRVKFGPKHLRPLLKQVTEFRAAAVRTADDMLHTGPLDRKLSPADRKRFSATVSELVAMAGETYRTVDGFRKTACPACGGKTLPPADAALLEAILSEQSANGTIPKDSVLYREPLTPVSEL